MLKSSVTQPSTTILGDSNNWTGHFQINGHYIKNKQTVFVMRCRHRRLICDIEFVTVNVAIRHEVVIGIVIVISVASIDVILRNTQKYSHQVEQFNAADNQKPV